MDDLFADFLAETREMLEALGGELVSWEEDPGDRARLDSIFRFFHTVKGNCGFFDFPRLEALSHAAEDALADVRADRRKPDAAFVSAVLAIVDRIDDMIDAIEAGDDLPDHGDDALIAALQAGGALPGELIHAQQAPGNDEQPARSSANRSIRLPVELLDRVMSGVSDMVLARNELARRLRDSSVEASVHEPFERLSSIIGEVRDAMTQTRMQRVEALFSALPRYVRDVSAELGKQVLLEIDGSEVELDREMIEIVRNPLTHIIRNAIDHGIEGPAARLTARKREAGLLSVSARQSGNQILIDVTDDGQGIDHAKLVERAIAAGIIDASHAARLSLRERTALIFEPGISTANIVTAISGRGVGMDVVRANIERVGGAIEVESTPGEGTRLTLRVPLTLTIIPALTVSIGNQRFAIPRSSIEEILHFADDPGKISRVGGAMLAEIRNRRLPCLILADLLRMESAVADEERTLVVLRLAGGELFGLAVDRLHGHEELVMKPVAPAIIAAGIYAGTTLTDEGSPILLLEVTGLARAGGLQLEALERSARQVDGSGSDAAAQTTAVLLFIGLDGKRKAVPMAVVDRIDEVHVAAVEFEGSRALVVIGERILPLAGTEGALLPEESLRLFRLSDGQREIGYAIHEALGLRQMDARLISGEGSGDLEGLALIDGEPTAVISPYKLFARHAFALAREAPPACHLPADDHWLQSFVRPIVEAAGYRVVDADHTEVDVAILSQADDAGPVSARKVIRLRSIPEAMPDEPDSIYRYDHAGLLSALHLSSGRQCL